MKQNVLKRKDFLNLLADHEKQKKARRFVKLGDHRGDLRHCRNHTKFIKGQHPTGQELFS